MNKTILFKEIHSELRKLNEKIDAKIVKGYSYTKEARRHKNLITTLQRMANEAEVSVPKRRSRYGKSPVRRRLSGGALARFFTWNFA